jgi:hypothetical protein
MARELGVILVVTGMVLVVVGLLFLANRPGWVLLGRPPGDLRWQRPRCTIYVPIATCVLLSIIPTVLLRLILRR